MKPMEIKGARARLGFTQRNMADKLNLSVATYNQKENGRVQFTDGEKVYIGEILGLSMEQINNFLYDGLLPLGKK